MAGVNKVLVLGRLGKDPEVRYLQDGKAVANFSVATSEEWKDKATGEKKERVEWHRIVVFGRLAEICGEYLKKGSQAYFEGKNQTRSWEKDGVTHYTTEIIVQNMQMLDRASDTQPSGPRSDDQGGGNGGRPHEPYNRDSERVPGPGYLDDGGDIPF